MPGIPEEIRCVALDAVGTVIEAVPSVVEVYHEYAVKHGSQLTQDEIKQRFKSAFQKNWLARMTQHESVESAEEEEYLLWQRIVGDTLDEYTNKSKCFEELHDYFSRGTAWKPYADVSPLLEDLKQRGISVVIASNFDRRLHRVVREISDFKTAAGVFPSTETLHRKPEQEFFRHIEQKMELAPEEMLLIGDSWNEDITGATNAGWQAIFIDRQHQNLAAETANQQKNKLLTPVISIHSLTELVLKS